MGKKINYKKINRTEEQWDKLYNTYISKYTEIEDKSAGWVTMEEIYTKAEFKLNYQALENDRNKEIAKGTRKVANTMRDLVLDQRELDRSDKQARAIKKAAEKLGYTDIKLKDIKSGKWKEKTDFWNQISNRQKAVEQKESLTNAYNAGAISDYDYYEALDELEQQYIDINIEVGNVWPGSEEED